MSETTSVILPLTVSIGALALMLSWGGLDWIDIDGLDNLNESNIEPEPISSINEINRSEIEDRDGRIYWTGETNDLDGEYGYITFDVSDINATRYIAFNDGRFFGEGVQFYLDDERLFQSANPQDIDFSGVDTFRIEINTEDSYVSSVSVQEQASGLSRLDILLSIFSISASELWFQLLVSIPLSAVSIWLGIKVIRGI